MRSSLEDWQRSGTVAGQPLLLAMLAQAYQRAGRPDEGILVLEDGLKLVERTGVRPNEAELHRLKGEMLLAAGEEAERAEVCFQRALEIAREQHAKSWELRAATGLARLWQNQGRAGDSQALLAPVYAWFTEGLDTPDLMEAWTLLQELSGKSPSES